MSITLNASTSSGFVQSADNSGEIELQSNGTTALKVNTNEGIQILNCLGVGNATPSTSGAGITFPATQSASTDANTLDDYEEGTWTPTIGGNATYIARAGSYVKVGRIVYLQFIIRVNARGTGSTTEITGLPFNTDTTTVGRNAISFSYFDSITPSVVYLSGNCEGTKISFLGMTAANTGVTDGIAIFKDNAYLIASGCYTTTS